MIVQEVQGSHNFVAPCALAYKECDLHTSNAGGPNNSDKEKRAFDKVEGYINRIHNNGSTDCKLLFDINNTWDGDKFLNTVVPKYVEKYLNGKQQPNTNLFYEWRHQNVFDFSFVPLSDFIMPVNNQIDPFQMHEKIKASCLLNYLGCTIPVNS